MFTKRFAQQFVQRLASVGVYAPAALLSSNAMAQVITISVGQPTVPLSPWLAGLTAAALALAAFCALRRRRGAAAFLAAVGLLSAVLAAHAPRSEARPGCVSAQPTGTGEGCLFLTTRPSVTSSDYQFRN